MDENSEKQDADFNAKQIKFAEGEKEKWEKHRNTMVVRLKPYNKI